MSHVTDGFSAISQCNSRHIEKYVFIHSFLCTWIQKPGFFQFVEMVKVKLGGLFFFDKTLIKFQQKHHPTLLEAKIHLPIEFCMHNHCV